MALPFALARLAAGLARLASRLSGRGGSALPGKVLLTLHPRALERLHRRYTRARTVLVSATNGKTTLTAMLAAIAHEAGAVTVHNATGANLQSGIASALMRAPRDAHLLLIEVDEATLPIVAPQLRPDVIVLGNLFRDQLDRYGELETLADRWAEMLERLPLDTRIVYNADDPLIADLAHSAGEHHRVQTLAWGMDDPAVALERMPDSADSTFCRRCGTPLEWNSAWLGHLGDWRCPGCGRARPPLDVAAHQVDLEGLGATAVWVVGGGGDAPVLQLRARIPGLYNAYNILGAAAAARAVGLPDDSVRAGIAAFSPAFGRFERVPVPGGGSVTLLLVKNPTGLNEVIRTLLDARVDLRACMFALNDGIADGRDISWIWDADVEPLVQAAPALIATGERAAEFALRAVYGGAPAEGLTIEPDLQEALALLLQRAADFTEHGHAYALLTYTAMLELRSVIRARGWVSAFWDERGRTSEAVTAP